MRFEFTITADGWDSLDDAAEALIELAEVVSDLWEGHGPGYMVAVSSFQDGAE